MRSINEVQSDPTTKRELLSVTQRVFDPIGFTCPATLVPKLLLQDTWKLRIGWDQPLPASIAEKFGNWLSQAKWIGQCRLPRWFGTCTGDATRLSLHTFCDASKTAYAACVFIRVEKGDAVDVHLVQAKARVSPLKPITIPRLELLAAVIGARLYAAVQRSLMLSDVTSLLWTDSMVVLSWIQRDKQWNTFVRNRVKEIHSLTNENEWRHVPGNANPADLLSRGCSGKALLHSEWWKGPPWLREGCISWPKSELECPEDEVFSERVKTVNSHLVECESREKSMDIFYRFSRYNKIIRVIGWMLRFPLNVRGKEDRRIGQLTCEEIKGAEETVWKIIQRETWGEGVDSTVHNLHTFIDERGLIRVKTKLLLGEESDCFKCPILLPGRHIVIRRLIEEEHRRLCHAGAYMLQGILRERYWISRSRRVIRQVISNCIACQRHKAKLTDVPFAPLPSDRIGNTNAFQITGVDLAGPLYLKGKIKTWIVLFTCAVYRAVHFELTGSLSTEAFLRALRRFVARRGRPSTIYCDNGTNFVGTYNALRELDWDVIQTKSTIERITWKFNPPTAAWWGGWWERMVRLMKELLRRNLGRASLRYEELMTVLCDCESVINSRPLTCITDDISDLVPLTPSLFIQPITESGVVDLDHIDAASLKRRLRYVQHLRQGLRSWFRKEYLSQLVHFGTRRVKPLCVGDVVLVECHNKGRIEWPLGRVVEIMPGRDGLDRVARVKTLGGQLVRPFQRLYSLEMSSADAKELSNSRKVSEGRQSCSAPTDDPQLPVVRVSRSGRQVKVPERLDL